MATISLSRGGEVLVDDADFEWLSQYKWYFKAGYACRYVPGSGYGKKDYTEQYMHHLICGHTPARSEGNIHHKNGNRLDNRRSNLEFLTPVEHRRQRMANIEAMVLAGPRARKDGDFPYKGVYAIPGKELWQVIFPVNGKSLNLGRYTDPEEAALVYDAAVLHYRGGEGYLNLLPDPGELSPRLRPIEIDSMRRAA